VNCRNDEHDHTGGDGFGLVSSSCAESISDNRDAGTEEATTTREPYPLQSDIIDREASLDQIRVILQTVREVSMQWHEKKKSLYGGCT
jgi:hypothetical protein